MLSPHICQKARLSRDSRFDGKFFTAVKTTGIYCRPICPAAPPKEENVTYFTSAIEAANAGYRPCLRCRPDSAPGSPAWKGVNTTLERAIKLIGEGALQDSSLPKLAERLGITDRYLRQLFKQHLGISPKQFSLYQQCLFAKQLLHQTTLPITQVALASGFNSIRRFNDCFQSLLSLTPSQIRQSSQENCNNNTLLLKLYYRPPYNWLHLQQFLEARYIPGLEWVDEQSYGRTFRWAGCTGEFTARHVEYENRFDVTIELDDITHLKPIIHNIRRLLDVDADVEIIEQDLLRNLGDTIFKVGAFQTGLRLPGIWNLFEAGVRAILGQQVSVVAARKLVTNLVEALGQPAGVKRLFPSPQSIAKSELDCLKIPASRKQTLRHFAQHYLNHATPDDPLQWLAIKGIGPWTVNYAQLRGLSDPDIYLGGDLGIKKALDKLGFDFDPDLAAPWRSYLTLQLWSIGSL